MACGTGKTFTALKIAESLASSNGTVLFLVPSIALLSQSLREWTAEAGVSLHSFAVCSDAKVTQQAKDLDISAHDLAFPATTDGRKLAHQMKAFGDKSWLRVVFSTYQSIQAVAEAQAQGIPEFDLIICDEAHRTTGTTYAGEEESHFVRVHDQDVIKAKKRLYMTATPRIYDDNVRTQAQQNDVTLCSMDDEKLYGPEFHRLGFGEAVGSGLLSDYKVMVLAVDEKYVSRAFQAQLADKSNELNLDDAIRITGCWNGLSKRIAAVSDIVGSSEDLGNDAAPMRRAVAFSRSIKDSKRFTDLFAGIVDEYRRDHPEEENLLCCEVEHVDGTFNALKRNEKLDWLKADAPPEENTCRVLSNARCLSEGVDVPALDAVMFLNPRNSVVDVVQSVGRVMRKAEGKKYGYIILPIGIPADVEPEEALKNNDKYKVVWQVLQALRAHDDRFNATVNQIELNKQRPDQIQVIGVGGDTDPPDGDGAPALGQARAVQFAFNFPHIEQWRDAIYAKIVQKCGDRRYWESWAKDVATIAARHEARINALLADPNPEHKKAFDTFLAGLRDNLNPSISQDDAIEMLSQHLITKPVFDALFEGYEFTKHNPVSVAMQNILNVLEGQALEKETASLDNFYASVKERARGIDNAEGKQKIITELYDKFFRSAFPRVADRLGIVYTPVEIVDFILRSTDEALKGEFGVSISDRDVHVLDPFTGTGTFLVRLLQSGLIAPGDMARKYQRELHANELVLLAYYIAAINIEEAFHGTTDSLYTPFDGIVLTDTFQLTEAGRSLDAVMFPDNNKRAVQQNTSEIQVIVGNPPYSAQQESQNDNNKNIGYPILDDRIRTTYAAVSKATLKKNLYDSYVRAIRWASDRIGTQGVVCYVTNGSFIDANNMDGLRKGLTDDFSTVYCFNLRGNQRTSGELSRKEGGKVFGSGSRTPVAITLLIKNPAKTGPCELHYYDIGEYLTREEKLARVAEFESVQGIRWEPIVPNSNHDWTNQRDESFAAFPVLGDKKTGQTALFDVYSLGVSTNRDAWAYNFDKNHLSLTMSGMISFYNNEVQRFQGLAGSQLSLPKVETVINTDPTKISWSDGLKHNLERGKRFAFDEGCIVRSLYRPFTPQWLYFDRNFNERVLLIPRLFPTPKHHNLVISLTGVGASKDFSALITDLIPNLHLHDTGQCFPLYHYEKREVADGQNPGLFSEDDAMESEYERKEAVTDDALAQYQSHYNDSRITKEDIFYYVYGILHSAEYKRRFAANLKKMLPRIPMAQAFLAFSDAGRELAEWHIQYETAEAYPLQESADGFGFDRGEHYKVRKMTFGKMNGKPDKSVIVYNSHVTLSGIPLEAYDYIVNGKSALEWVMERYQYTRDKDSQIVNDPNVYSDDPAYIINLVKRIVRVSLETVRIVNSLPPLNESA